jgi:hypothetical protein
MVVKVVRCSTHGWDVCDLHGYRTKTGEAAGDEERPCIAESADSKFQRAQSTVPAAVLIRERRGTAPRASLPRGSSSRWCSSRPSGCY